MGLGKRQQFSKPQKRECSCQAAPHQPQRGCVILRPTLTRPLTWPLAWLSTQSGRRYDTSSVLESGAPPNDTNLVIARPGSPFDCSKTAVGCIRPSLEVGPRNEHILHHVGEAAKTRVEDDGHHLITKPLPPLLIPMEHKINTRCRSLPSSLPVPIHSHSEARESVQNLAGTGFVQDSQTNNPQCEDKNNFACESRINA